MTQKRYRDGSTLALGLRINDLYVMEEDCVSPRSTALYLASFHIAEVNFSFEEDLASLLCSPARTHAHTHTHTQTHPRSEPNKTKKKLLSYISHVRMVPDTLIG